LSAAAAVRLSYFIYYRLRPEAAARAAAAVAAMQQRLGEVTGISGRVLQRADDAMTWMEIYEGVSDAAAFQDAMERLVAEYGLTDLLAEGQVRHVERFAQCA
jgi:hypothetical protein